MRRRTLLTVIAASTLSHLACAGGCGRLESQCEVAGQPEPPEHWRAVCEEFDAIDQPRELSLQVGDASGAILTYTRGSITPQSYHRIASASKWMAAAAIMRLVERGELSLQDHPQDYIEWWTSDPEDSRSQITLGHLLSLTSGFGGSPLEVRCVNRARSDLDACSRELYDEYFVHEMPGQTYHYGPVHMHVAGLMAQEATGRSWSELFAAEVVAPLGLDERTVYTVAGEDHPRIAGGISTTGEAYAEFLRAQLAGEYLPGQLEVMAVDRTPSGQVTLAHSPLTEAGREWHYGYGLWRECPEEIFSAACVEHVRISSPGAYGFYPWIDRRHEYWGVLSTDRSILTGAATDSVLAGERVQPLLEAALQAHRQGSE